MQWNLYDDPDENNLIMFNIYIESYVADPGAKLCPVDSEDRLEMCERLRKGIEISERRLKRHIEGAKLAENEKTAKNIYGGYGPYQRDKETVEALERERKEYYRKAKDGIKRMKAELERLQKLQ